MLTSIVVPMVNVSTVVVNAKMLMVLRMGIPANTVKWHQICVCGRLRYNVAAMDLATTVSVCAQVVLPAFTASTQHRVVAVGAVAMEIAGGGAVVAMEIATANTLKSNKSAKIVLMMVESPLMTRTSAKLQPER